MATSILDPILNPFLSLDSGLSIIIVSFLISLIITLVYKYTTNQVLIKDLKKQMKVKQKEIRQIKDPKKAMSKNKEVMEINMKIMGQTMKSTLYTLIPMLFIFGWMGAHYVYEPLQPDLPFTLTINSNNIHLENTTNLKIINQKNSSNSTEFTLEAKSGTYLLKFYKEGKEIPYPFKLTVSSNLGIYEEPKKSFEDSTKISVTMTELKPFGDFSLFGWKPGWLGSYILASIIFSMLTRKLLKVE